MCVQGLAGLHNLASLYFVFGRVCVNVFVKGFGEVCAVFAWARKREVFTYDIFFIFIFIVFNPLTANVRIYPYQGHGHQKESQHRYFWTDFYNQDIVGKVLFCSKRGCLYFWNRLRNDDVARLRSLNSARCPRSIAIAAAAALNSGAGCCRDNS